MLSLSLSELNDNVTVELGLLQPCQGTLGKLIQEMKVVQSSFNEMLDLMVRAIDHCSVFLSLVDYHFCWMQHDVEQLCLQLFLNETTSCCLHGHLSACCAVWLMSM